MNDKNKIFITLFVVIMILIIWIVYTFASISGFVPVITEI